MCVCVCVCLFVCLCAGGFYVTHRMLQMFVIKDEMRSLSAPNDNPHHNELHRKERFRRTQAT